MSNFSAAHLHNEEAAYAYIEARLWPHGATCPKCGECKRVKKLQGKSTRIGTYYCNACRKPFTVKVGTIFESSHVPMHVWLQAITMMTGSKKGISSNQLHRHLSVTLKTAWFMSHRIREAMRSGALAPMGSDGGMVEVDETFIGNDPARPKKPNDRGYQHKMKVLSLVDRTTGRAKSMVVDDLTAKALLPILQANIAKEATVLTDEAGYHQKLAADFAGHYWVNHSAGQYVNFEMPEVHTNTIEGFFSVFKRGMRGIYQHCGKRHLHRYMAEFDFRYSHRVALGIGDAERADHALLGAVGKRLTYQTIGV